MRTFRGFELEISAGGFFSSNQIDSDRRILYFLDVLDVPTEDGSGPLDAVSNHIYEPRLIAEVFSCIVFSPKFRQIPFSRNLRGPLGEYSSNARPAGSDEFFWASFSIESWPTDEIRVLFNSPRRYPKNSPRKTAISSIGLVHIKSARI